MTRDEIIDLICRKANQWGIDRAELLGGAIAESGLDPDAWRQGEWPDWSEGLFQQTVKYADEGDQTASPENVALIRALYADPSHACDVAAKKYLYWRHDPDVLAEQAWCAYNWPGSYGRYTGNPNLANYRRGLSEATAIVAALDEIKEPAPMPLSGLYFQTVDIVNVREAPTVESSILTQVAPQTVVEARGEHGWWPVRLADGTEGWMAADLLEPGDFGSDFLRAKETVQIATRPPQLAFNASTPTELQVLDWTCSIRSTMWMLKSIGIDVTPAEAQDAMSPRYVSPAVGLLDASGAGIVAVLSDRWHVAAFNRNPVSFDEVAEQAGKLPVAMGGRAWGHWVAVRGFDGERLVLANPGGTGPRYGQQTLDRGQFAQLGPFSMVVVTGRI